MRKLLLLFFILVSGMSYAQFTAGNLVVEQIGDGTTALSSAAAKVQLLQFTPTGSSATGSGFFGSNGTPTSAPYNIVDSGSATSNGYISLSVDKKFILVPGYNAPNGTTSIASSVAATSGRTIGKALPNGSLQANGTFTALSGQNYRSVVSDGSGYWLVGSVANGVQGIVYTSTDISTGNGTVTPIFGNGASSSATGNSRIANIFNNTLFVSTSSSVFNGTSSSLGIYQVGTFNNLPTSTATVTNVINTASGTGTPSPFSFTFSPNGLTCYVADDRTIANGGGIQKWSYSGTFSTSTGWAGGIWSLAYTLGTGTSSTVGARGLTVDFSGTNPILYATTAETSLNRLIAITDSGASSTATTLATATANYIFRGVAFAPENPKVNLSVSANTGTEAGTTAITLTATASGAVTGSQTVDISVTGTGITTGDFTLSSNTITIANGATTGTATFTIANDALGEGDETAVITISNPSANITLGATVSQNITIVDDESVVNLSVSTNTSTEAAATVVTVTATASLAVVGDQTVDVTITGTDVTAGDYTLSASKITILSGQTTGFVTFTIADDAVIESLETATITISNATNGIILGATTTQNVTIADNDFPTVNLSVSANSGSEAAATVITVTATASIPVVGDQTVSVAVSGTDITIGDYSLSATTITILGGQTTGSVTFTIVDDTLLESTETASISIASPSSGISLGAATSQNVTITDNDAIPVNLSLSAAAGTEAGATEIIVTATASSAVLGDQTIAVGVSGTGVTPSDYTLTNTTITIANGAATGSVTFKVVNDTAAEACTETATVSISSPSTGITLGSTTSQNITITDNDNAVNLTVSASGLGYEFSTSAITLTATAAAAVSGDQTVSVAISGTGITATDYTLSSSTLTILSGATTGTVTFTVANDTGLEGTEYPVVAISNPSSCIVLGSTVKRDLAIFDNDFAAAPTANKEIELTFVSSYLNVGPNPDNSAEISAYDPISKRLFVVNSLGRKMNILDFSNPASITNVATVDISTFGGINSIAVKNGIVAVAIEASNLTDNGSILFYNAQGVLQKQVTAGAMPDMITFSPNGNLVLTANEGEPNDAYTVDPEGTVTIVDISGGIANVSQSNVTTVNFNSFESQLATLKSQGLRVYGPNNPTLSKDVEPEYITFSANGNTAFVTLQEANAIAELDIATKTFTAIRPLGLKDHNLIKNGLDASDNGITFANIANLPIKGMYQPDAIASYTVNNETYLITANEGDSRVYPRAGSTVGAEGSIYSEEVRVNATTYILDPIVFPNAVLLKNNAVLGRLQLTNRTGDTDGDGDFDEIHALGARSFSIWKSTANGLQQVFDSGDQFERITLADPTYGSIFNASHDNTTAKNRSDNKGPEPEGVSIATISGKTYAFISLERIGGVMVYNVTDPVNPVFVQWANSRSTSTTAAVTGDRGSEGIFFISAKDSPTGVPLVVLSNEVSSTISVYSVDNGVLAPAPTALTVVNSNTQLSTTLTWTDNSSNETAFDIQRSTSETTGFASIGSVLPNVVTYTDNTVVAGTTYFYRVRAANDFGYTNSNTVSVLTKQNQTITFAAPADKTIGDAAFSLGATASSGLAIAYTTASDKITISGSQATLVKAGRATVSATQAGSASFLPATPVERSFCIKPAKPTITLSNTNTETPTLTSSATAGNQWFLNGTAIAAATNATLNVTTAGLYKVQVKVDDCASEFSAEQSIIVTGDINARINQTVIAFPNPVKDVITVLFDSETGKKEVAITELTGKEMLRQEVSGKEATFNVQSYSQGIYLIKVLTDKEPTVIRFEKQ